MDISTFHSISEHVVWSERDMSAINLVFSGLASHLGTMGVILSFRVVYMHTSWSLKVSCRSPGAQIRT